MEIKRTFVVDKTQRFNGRNERLKPFVERINASRIAAKYKPYTPAYIASKMSHIATEDLEGFYKKLDQSNNFGALWHWYCKPKKKWDVHTHQKYNGRKSSAGFAERTVSHTSQLSTLIDYWS